jgi:hypothetical protein
MVVVQRGTNLVTVHDVLEWISVQEGSSILSLRVVGRTRRSPGSDNERNGVSARGLDDFANASSINAYRYQ